LANDGGYVPVEGWQLPLLSTVHVPIAVPLDALPE
jgi:hypothetical protein